MKNVKEGLIVKHKEVDISRIRTAVKLTQSTWTLASNDKAEHAVRLKCSLVMHQWPTQLGFTVRVHHCLWYVT